MRRRVIRLEGRLEWVAGMATSGTARGATTCVVLIAIAHEDVVLFGLLLAAPDPPGNEAEGTEDDGTADAYNNADDDVPRLLRHARGATGAALRKTRSLGHGTLRGEGSRFAIRVSRGDDFGKRFRDGVIRGIRVGGFGVILGRGSLGVRRLRSRRVRLGRGAGGRVIVTVIIGRSCRGWRRGRRRRGRGRRCFFVGASTRSLPLDESAVGPVAIVAESGLRDARHGKGDEEDPQ